MRRTRPAPARLARAVLVLVMGALLLSGCDFSVYSLPLPGGAKLGDDPYTVKVEFRDVLDLVPQSSVKVNDVSVGRVDGIKVVGQHAVVTIKVRKAVKLPDNAIATIRQTSLLGEKFVSLAPPDKGAHGRLGNGDVIPLSRSGRNPEVEEVLGALSLLLNGGGVAQLKMIASELNNALGGREGDARSLLDQVNVLVKHLDDNKDTIVTAIESLNRLAIALNKQKPAITRALDQLPRAVASVNRQRDDLVRMLKALDRLSAVGTRVITQSKQATVDSLRALAPTLTKLAQAGNDLPKSFQIFLTFPFVDAVVGTNAAQARNLHVGDYTNLAIKFDVDLSNLGVGQLCSTVPALGDLPVNICDNPALLSCAQQLLNVDLNDIGGSITTVLGDLLTNCTKAALQTVCNAAGLPTQITQVCTAIFSLPLTLPPLPIKVPSLSKLTACLTSGKPMGSACDAINPLLLVQRCAATTSKKKPDGYYSETCKRYRELNLGVVKGGVLGQLPVLGDGGGSSGGGGLGGVGGGLGGGGGGLGGLLGANRAAAGPSGAATSGSASGRAAGRPSDLSAMLLWGMMQR